MGMRCTRRNFCAGLATLVAAPYVIRNSGVLMPVRDRRLYATYFVSGRNALDQIQQETIRVAAHKIARDITGLHTLADLSGMKWRNIDFIGHIQTG